MMGLSDSYGRVVTGVGGINTHKHTQAHVHIKHSPTAVTFTAKLLAFICHLMHFYIHGHILNVPISFSSVTICFYITSRHWSSYERKRKNSDHLFQLLVIKESPQQNCETFFIMASASSLAHSPLTGPESPLSLEKFIFCSSSNKLSLNNVLEGTPLYVIHIKAKPLLNNEHILYFRSTTILCTDFINLFKKHLLSTYCMLSTELGFRDTSKKKQKTWFLLFSSI